MFEARYVSSLVLVLMGSMDCLTTVIGTLYFGTVELNPLIATLVNTNLPAFVVIKLTVTVSVGLIFVLAENTLIKTLNKTTKAFRMTHNILKIVFTGTIFFLVIVVANNIFVIIKILG